MFQRREAYFSSWCSWLLPQGAKFIILGLTFENFQDLNHTYHHVGKTNSTNKCSSRSVLYHPCQPLLPQTTAPPLLIKFVYNTTQQFPTTCSNFLPLVIVLHVSGQHTAHLNCHLTFNTLLRVYDDKVVWKRERHLLTCVKCLV